MRENERYIAEQSGGCFEDRIGIGERRAGTQATLKDAATLSLRCLPTFTGSAGRSHLKGVASHPRCRLPWNVYLTASDCCL